MIAYMITLGVAQLFYGVFSDNYGRKKAILVSFVIAILGFIVSALSQNIAMLYVGRILTALGTAGCPVIARALISDICTDSIHVKKAFSYFSMSSQCSPAFAPILGGAIQQYADWHWSFVALAVINIVAFLILFMILPETHRIPQAKKILSEQVKVYWELLGLRRFMFFNFFSSLMFVFTIGFYSLTPFVFKALGLAPIENGLFYGIYAIGLVAGSLGLATVFSKMNSEKTFFWGLVLFFILFTLGLAVFSFTNSLILIGIFSFILAFLCGLVAPLVMSLCLEGFSVNKGAASAVQSLIKLGFSGVVLFMFNFVELYSFIDILMIFEVIAIVLWLGYGVEKWYQKM